MQQDINLEKALYPTMVYYNTLTSMSFLFLPPLTGSGFPQWNNLLEGYKSAITDTDTLLSHWPIVYFVKT